MFLMLPLLFGLGTVAIPVIVHLLHRQRTTPIKWGAMRFLIESPLRQKRRRNIEHWLLMVARMAVLAVLVFALARPLLDSDLATPIGGGTSTDFAVVLDHSLSTGRAAGEGGKSVFGRGVDLVVDQISPALRPSDTLSVILAEHAPRPLNERPVPAGSSDIGKLREALRQTKVGTTDASVPQAIQVARDVVNHGRGIHKKIVVISDEQRVGWQVGDATAWKIALSDGAGGIDRSVAVFDLPIAPDTTLANVSVGGVEVQPTVIGPGQPVAITATISQAGSGALPAAIPVTLIADGKPVASQSVTDLAGGASRTLRFDHTFATAGSHWIQVRADVPDALEADNVSTAALNVLDKLPVLIIDGQLTAAGAAGFRSSQFLTAAMQPVAEEAQESSTLVRPKIISVSSAAGANLADYAAVVVNDVPGLPGDVLARLADYARGGKGVWIILGPRTQARFAEELTAAQMFGVSMGAVDAQGSTPPGVAIADPANRMVSLLTGADRNALTGVVATRWWPLKTMPADARTIVATTSGSPLVLERPIGSAGGRVVLWATSADGRWNTLPLSPAFVPLVNETLLHLAGPSVAATFGRRLEAGRPIVWTGPLLPQPLGATLLTPELRGAGQQPLALKVSTESGRNIVRHDATHAPGLYEMRFTPSGVPQPVYYSVNIDPRELDAAVLSSADVQWLKDNEFLQARVTPDKLGAVLAAPGAGSELWPALAFGVLGLLVVETFMTYRMIRLRGAEVVV
jgi:hypothetical protein